MTARPSLISVPGIRAIAFGRAVRGEEPRWREQWLSLAERLVLCLVSQEPSHGFALAAVLAPDGEVGMVWHVRKAVVYRAAQRRERLGLITAEDRQHSRLGPITTGARRGKVSTLRATWGRNMAPYWLLDSPYSLVSVKLVLLALQEP